MRAEKGEGDIDGPGRGLTLEHKSAKREGMIYKICERSASKQPLWLIKE
jgi:hypothetical protein